MPDCVDLTCDSDDEITAGGRDRKRSRPPTPDSDCIIVDGDNQPDQQQKRQRVDAAADAAEDADVVVESATGTVALRDMAHARPQCGNHAFRAGNSQDNSRRCGECYCFVCDVKAEECQYWGNGSRARDHCNAHTSHYWNSLRKAARKGSGNAALLQQEFTSLSNTLSTNWTLPGANSNANSSSAAAATGRQSMLAAGGRGITSPLVTLWQRQKAAQNPTPPAPAAAAATPAAMAAAAAAGAGGTPATAPGRLGAPAPAVKTEGSKQQQPPQQQQQQQQQPKQKLKLKPFLQRPAHPPASSWLKRMPAPAQLKTPTQLLVRLELPFKTVKGVTVDDVARRLVPTGFYKDPTKMAHNIQYGEHLALDNIHSLRYCSEKRKQVPDALRLLPLVPVDGLPAEPDTGRPYKVNVISTTPGVKPLTVGVVVPYDCKVSKLQSAVEEALAAHGYNSSQEGLMLGIICRSVPEDTPVGPPTTDGSMEWFRDVEATRLQDQPPYTSKHNTWLAVRVPVAVAKDYHDMSSSAGRLVDPGSRAKILLLQHEKMLPSAEGATAVAQDDSEVDSEFELEGSDSDEEQDEFFEEHGRYWDAVERMQFQLRRDRRRRRGAQQQQGVVELGLPMAVLVPQGLSLSGGAVADRMLKEAVIQHLVHYKAAGGAAPSSRVADWSFKVYRHSGWTRQRMANCPYSTPSREFSVNGEALYTGYGSPGVRLWVNWGTDPVVPPAGFDMEAYTAIPQLNDPAFEQRLQDLPKLLKAAAAYSSAMKMLRAMPNTIVCELQTACACSVPPPSNTPADIARHAVTHKPSAAVLLSVVKAPGSSSSGSSGAGSSKGAAAKPAAAGSSAAAAIAAAAAQVEHKGKSPDMQRLGVLQVEVYVFTTSGRLHSRLFEDYDDWGSTVTGRPGRFRSTTCQLTSVLNARLLQEAGGYTLLKETNELNATHRPAQGIAKLMEWVAAGERTAAEQPPGLTVQLHPYQLQSLAFMQEAERWEGGWRHLLWEWLPPTPTHQRQLAGPSSSAAAVAAAAGGGGVVSVQPGVGPGVWWSPVLGRVASEVPAAPWGGFLAEEMGLGKTIEVLGLILSNPAAPSVVAGSTDPESGKIRSRGTLVVCAVSLVGQWCTEAAKKLNGSLKMYPYHGQNRIRNRQRLATEFDIVVTTYATLSSDFGGKKNQHRADNPLGDIKWHRIVFDEGHTVKNMSAAHSKACTALASDRRWICTGTPINNDISDLLGQFSVLHMQPFATKSYFDAYVKHAFASYGYGVSAVPLLYTMRHTMIRHTKAQTIQGQSVLALPEKTEDLVPVVLSSAEREAYMRVHSEAARVWAAVRTMAHAAINQKLLQVMSLLQPLRRICSGGRLTPHDLNVPADMLLEASAANVARSAAAAMSMAAAAAAGGPLLVQEDCNISVPDLECPICLDAFDTPVMTLCHHWFCKECILGVLSGNTHCPLCRGPVTPADLRAPGKKQPPAAKKRGRSKSSGGSDSGSEGGEESDDDAAEAAGPSGLTTRRGTRFGAGAADGNAVVCESKLRALLAELTAMREKDPTSKALVFSQYSNTLDWLKQRLPEEGFGYRTITGSMPLKQRSKAIEAFQGDPPTTVFLLSMRSGAVGINLTAASHVFLLEPCINPALEEQAIGRAWRMGQTRKVVVKRFYVKGSIEERIMDVRHIRQGHASHTGAGSSAAAAAAAAGSDNDIPPPAARMGKKKICAAELAGNLQADRQVLKIAELDLLFRTPELETSAGVPAAAAAAAGGDGAGSSRQAEAAAAAAAAAGSSGLAAAAAAGGGSAAGSSRQAEAAAAAAAAGSSGEQPGPTAAAAAGSSQLPAAAAAGGGVGSMGPPADRPGPSAAAAAAGSSGLGADLPGQELGGADGAAQGGGESEGLPELASQEARALAEAAGLQSSQEMTPYLMAQLQQQQRAWQLFEQRRQEEQQ